MLKINDFKQNKQTLLLAFLLIVMVGLSFRPCLTADFVSWDDDKTLLENPVIRQFSWPNLLALTEHSVSRIYSPLTWLSFNLEHQLFGFYPSIYHLDNLLLHTANTLLVFWLFLQLGLFPLAAAFAAGLFGLHPLNVEAVAWVSARKDVLCAFFYLGTLNFYWRYLDTNKRPLYLAALLSGLLSILAKPMALSLPVILFLFDFYKKRPLRPAVILEKIPFILIIEPVAWVTFALHDNLAPATWPQSALLPFWTAAFYIKKFFLPIGLSPMYKPPYPIVFSNPTFPFSLLICILFASGLIYWRKTRAVVFAGFFYCLSLFFLWRVNIQGANFVADRFMYLPQIGFCFLAGWLLNQITLYRSLPPTEGQAERKISRFQRFLFIAPAIMLFGFLSIQTFRYCLIWQNSSYLWNFIVSRYPNSSIAQNNLGEVLAREGKQEQALKKFSRAIVLNPQNAQAYYNTGVSLTLLGRFDTALSYFDQAILLEPKQAKAYNNRGYIKSRVAGKFAEALADFNQAIALDPLLAEAYNNRGFVLEHHDQRFEAAGKDYSKAIELKKDYAEAYFNRGGLLNGPLQKPPAAINDFSEVIKIEPKYEEAYLSRGFAYIQLGEYALALNDFNQALLLNPKSLPALINRGSLYLQKENYPAALADYRGALAIDPDNVQAQFLVAKCLQLFGNDDEAMIAFSLLLKSVDLAEGYYSRSLLFEKKGNYKKALADAQKAKELGWNVTEEFLNGLKEKLEGKKKK